jgi:hypothetical protein
MAGVAIVSSLPAVLVARKKLRNTTLLGAWLWAAAALAGWGVSFFATEVLGVVVAGAADQMWLASAALVVCPFVAVLGAKRPGSRVWGLFIVMPLAIVLDLPAVTAWNRDFHPAPLHLEVPMLAGYALVVLMGAGNYLGTRFAIPAFLAAASVMIVPVSMSSLQWLPEGFPARGAATLLLAISIWVAALATQRSAKRRGATPFDALWSDFRDLYGIVWARRILDRVNETAVHESWSVRLHLDGFAPVDPTNVLSISPKQSQQIEHALRWLLRRFVDPEWIDERIAEGERGA